MRWGNKNLGAVVLSLLLAIGSAAAMSTPVSQLPTAATYGTAVVAVKSDVTSGTCRTIQYGTAAGTIQVQVCDKGSTYELYRQANPSGTFKACVGNGCVDNYGGYAAFTGTTLPTGMTGTTIVTTPTNTTNKTRAVNPGNITPTPTPTPVPTVTGSLVSPSSTIGGMSADAYFEMMVDSWFKSSNVIQRIQTTSGTALWVPWYNSATASAVTNLQSGANCQIGTVDYNNNCLVTDEFSQVGDLLSMSSRHQQDFDQWFTTVKLLRGNYGTLPVWKASRTATGISTAITGNQDSASDADARIITALYTAANNPAFDATARATYKAYADTMAADFIKYDFMHTSKPGLNGVTISNFPASGGAVGTGNGMTWGSADYAGYAGDRAIALEAAYKSTGNSVYLSYAKDDVNAYLLAANWNGMTFSVPPKSYSWDLSGTTPKAVCSSNCGSSSWDDSDAVRAVSLAKAEYDAGLMGVDLGLKPYLQAWMKSGGVQSNAYAIQYSFGGTPVSSVTGGMYENGLGATLNFEENTQDLATKLNEVATHYSTSTGTFDWTPSDGVYRSTFFKVNLGSAIGRDRGVFSGASTTGTTGTTGTTTSTGNTTPTPVPTPTSSGVAGLNVVCSTSPGGAACATVSDITSGCRTIKYTSNGQAEQVQICDKTTAYEMYDQVHNGQTTTCVGTACVGPATGYARWSK